MKIENPFKGMPKWGIYATVIGTSVIGGWALVRHHKDTGSWSPFATATAANAADTSGTDPITGLPYTDDSATDPMTGLTYLAEAQQYGSVAAAEASVSSFGSSTASGSGIPVNPASPASSGSINTPVGTSVYTSNAAWAQAATAGLTDVGYDGPTVAQALGAYLTQTPLTSAQATLVNTAIAEYGPAPIGNLQVILAPVSQPSSTPPPATTAKPAMPTGVHFTPYANQIDVGWSPVSGATSYTLHATYQESASGSSGVYPGTVSGTSGQIKGLSPNRTYTLHVAAVNAAGTGPQTNGPAAKTKAS